MSYKKQIYQIQRVGSGYSLRHAEIIVCEQLDGSIVLTRGSEILKHKTFSNVHEEPEVVDVKEINAFLDEKLRRVAA